MLGLRTQESSNFENFLNLVQKEAQKKNCVFFVDTQESIEQTIGNCDCMNLSGWLIPKASINGFIKPYENFDNLDKWEQFEAWVSWKSDPNNISISIDYL